VVRHTWLGREGERRDGVDAGGEAERDDEVVRDGRAGGHVLVDERLVLQLLPLRRREQPPPAATTGVSAQHHPSLLLRARPRKKKLVAVERLPRAPDRELAQGPSEVGRSLILACHSREREGIMCPCQDDALYCTHHHRAAAYDGVRRAIWLCCCWIQRVSEREGGSS
jgi:hypothetical protein